MYMHPGSESCTAKDGQIVSRHRTLEGIVVYAYCDTGGLHMWVEPHESKAPHRTTIAA